MIQCKLGQICRQSVRRWPFIVNPKSTSVSKSGSGKSMTTTAVIKVQSHDGSSRQSPSSLKAFVADEGDVAGNDGFDGAEFDKALQKMTGGVGTGGILTSTTEEGSEILQAMNEEIYRVFPYGDKQLPILPDCDNYYSGSYKDYFWHQNADNVYVAIPIADNVGKKQIEVNFQATSVTIYISDKELVHFKAEERLIPDGSFWFIEEDKEGKRYLFIDIEKRFRMINWKCLFSENQMEEDAEEIDKKSAMLEKLFAANKGMSKLMGGIEPESMQDMMSNGDLTSMLADEIYGPEVVDGDDLTEVDMDELKNAGFEIPGDGIKMPSIAIDTEEIKQDEGEEEREE